MAHLPVAMAALAFLAATAAASRPSIVNCTWKQYTQPNDHFGSIPGTFSQRVCLYSHYYATKPADAPPLMFFYTGNESPLEVYVNNTGFMWELGAQRHALLVWAEHRFEPETHPSLQGTQSCFGLGTSAQALADYAQLIPTLRAEFSLPPEAAVIAFGGSYGGMLAGWMRIRYPDILAGAIAASAPVFGLATTMRSERLDWSARAIARGISKAGGASDRCLGNVRAAWPLIEAVGKSRVGLRLLSEAARACAPESVRRVQELLDWAKAPWFDMAEGNFPFESTYITYAVGPGYFPLPAWPLRAACAKGLDGDLGVQVTGDVESVNYTVSIGEKLALRVDWEKAVPVGWRPEDLDEAAVHSSGVLELMRSITEAVGVWYNVSKDKHCFALSYERDSPQQQPRTSLLRAAAKPPRRGRADSVIAPNASACAACPVCADCPPCPVAACQPGVCSYKASLEKTASWDFVTCSEDLYLHNLDVQGLGRDLWWPPSVTPRHEPTVEEIVGPHELRAGCGKEKAAEGLPGGPLHSDPWSGFLSAYYQGPNISRVRNIVWSNGLLDPWSGGGVYPPGGGIEGGIRQNISEDGSQVALLIDLGAHHLDLMFSTERDPPSARRAREIEAEMIDGWAAEWRAAHRSQGRVVTV